MTMHYPLLVSSILNRARTAFPSKEIITRVDGADGVEGGVHRYTYRDMAARVNKLCNALGALGVRQGGPGRDLCLEPLPPPGGLFCLSGYGRGQSHHQHPPLPRRPGLHRQPRPRTR